VKQHLADIERELANDRLVDEATRNSRPLRARVAERLYALAALVEGQPHLRTNELRALGR
jgi:hypothetical protein